MVCLELLAEGRLYVKHVRSYAGFLPTRRLGGQPRAIPALVELYSSTCDPYATPTAVAETAQQLATIPSVTVRHYVTRQVEHAFGPHWLDVSLFIPWST